MNFSELKNSINNAVVEFNKDFLAKHDEPDFGYCGSAVVLIGFGRKRKIKRMFEEAELLGMEWTSYGKKMYVLKYDINCGVPVRTQFGGFYADQAKLVSDVVENFLPQNGEESVDVYTHSWVD